ncbi:hypothetical protein ACFQHW_03025 [Lapidilactobacillus achengensis]|uniref:Uncharacterized protein n=1 Tax=Lapidilactobacillus achengensis TaxID=2486000 RepID=A0ABW1ULK5_9LACO|nr:hypothetical protein [Lapidilactobacillus achengensis]
MPNGVSAQTAVKTLSGWSGEIRGEIAVKLSLAALPLRTRLSFEIRAGFAKLKVTPTASSPRISQRKLRTIYFYQPSPAQVATSLPNPSTKAVRKSKMASS